MDIGQLVGNRMIMYNAYVPMAKNYWMMTQVMSTFNHSPANVGGQVSTGVVVARGLSFPIDRKGEVMDGEREPTVALCPLKGARYIYCHDMAIQIPMRKVPALIRELEKLYSEYKNGTL